MCVTVCVRVCGVHVPLYVGPTRCAAVRARRLSCARMCVYVGWGLDAVRAAFVCAFVLACVRACVRAPYLFLFFTNMPQPKTLFRYEHIHGSKTTDSEGVLT